MKIHVLHTGVLRVNTLVVPTEGGKCFIVDPAACAVTGDENLILDYLKAHKLECEGIVLTHSHFDHITGITPLKKAFSDAKIALHEAELSELNGSGVPGPMNNSVLHFFGAPELLQVVGAQPAADTSLKEGMTIFGWKVLHTPGHTPGSVCLYKADGGEGADGGARGLLISGDTLFDYGGYGRTDMYGGDEAEIQKSLARLRREIPAGTLVYPGHDNCGFMM
jgi:glyoxylase-like metal-dependent hydrolase (beta-lactamase superfamily II)